jgi:hypothetical protein
MKKDNHMKNLFDLFRKPATCALAGAMLFGAGLSQAQAQITPQNKVKHFDFSLVKSAGVAQCTGLQRAWGRVRIEEFQENQHMRVELYGLPPQLGFDAFVIQAPDKPFGLSWYQGDISSDARGRAAADFIGIFSPETFTVAPGSTLAPTPHRADANANPATAPVHQYHLGIWFDSPETAKKAGCPPAVAAVVTPFNGDHTAGVQAFNTSQFPQLDGPLNHFRP